MPAMDYVRELHEATQRTAEELARRDLRLARDLAMSLADIRELDYLAKDYQQPDFSDDWWSR